MVLGDKKFSTLLREVKYKPATRELEHLSFQALLAGEPVTSTLRVVLLNREKVSGIIQQPQVEVSYSALPSHLIEKVEIDLEGMDVGHSMRISDLDIANDPNIEILSPLDSMVLSITEARRAVDEDETETATETDEHAVTTENE